MKNRANTICAIATANGLFLCTVEVSPSCTTSLEAKPNANRKNRPVTTQNNGWRSW